MGKLKTIERDEIFGNWRMFSKEGTLMCRLSTKKALWYVQRGLADIDEENRNIILKFEPNGIGDTNPFMLEDRQAICVVCGTDHGLTTHHVVPSCYRRHLPDSYKSHNSHDNLLICDRCHDLYERYAWQKKKQLQNIYAPIPQADRERRVALGRAVRAAYALVRDETRGDGHPWGHHNPGAPETKIKANSIPEWRKQELLAVIEPFNADLTLEGLAEFIRVMRKNPEHQDPAVDGESVMRAVIAQGDTHIRRFIEGWREHFLGTTQPQYLSENWSVDYHK